MNDLAELCKQVLLDNMRPSFKEALDRLLDRGLSRLSIVTFVRAKAQGHELVVAQVEAYLDSKGVK